MFRIVDDWSEASCALLERHSSGQLNGVWHTSESCLVNNEKTWESGGKSLIPQNNLCSHNIAVATQIRFLVSLSQDVDGRASYDSNAIEY